MNSYFAARRDTRQQLDSIRFGRQPFARSPMIPAPALTLFNSAVRSPIVLLHRRQTLPQHHQGDFAACHWPYWNRPENWGLEVFTKIMLYYFHERIWEKLSFGRVKEAKKDNSSFDI